MTKRSTIIEKYKQKVFICAPVKNRAWILPEYLKALESLLYPKHLLTFCFILNDSLDESEKLLEDFAQKCSVYNQQVIILKKDFGVDEWLRECPTEELMKNLPVLRNELINEFLKGDYDYYFSVDTDIIVKPDTLTRLLDCQKHIVAPWTYNTDIAESKPVQGYLSNISLKTIGGTYRNYDEFPQDTLFRVDAVSNIYLINREVIDSDVKCEYKISFFDEEIVFSADAVSRGFEVWCHSGVFCEHRMKEYSYESMAGLIRVLKLKKLLTIEEKQYGYLIELVTEQGEVIDLGEFGAYEQLAKYRKELVDNIKILEEKIKEINADVVSFFGEIDSSIPLNPLLPLFVEQCTWLVNRVNELAEELADLDLANQLLLQKKLMQM